MDRQASPPPPAAADTGAKLGLLWYLVLLGLFAWQGWMTLTLFAPPSLHGNSSISETASQAWARLLDDEPIVSGRHPLHLYFGYLGAQSLRERGTPCCFDPAHQAGYPKTPVFDTGSRPAELFVLLAGRHSRQAAYKIGVAICVCLVPILIALSAWGLRFCRAATCLAVAFGLLIWWSGPGQDALTDGALDLLLSSLCGLASISLLVRFDREPGVFGWFALVLTTCVGYYAHPLLLILLLPVALLYFLSVGARHSLIWHLALLSNLGIALLANSFWLLDWARSWWIRLPVQLGSEIMLRHRTFHTLWDCSLWGSPLDRAFALFLFALGIIGSVLLNQTKQRPAARLLFFGAAGFLALAIGGALSQPLGRLGAGELLLPALWFAAMPAAYVIVRLAPAWSAWLGSRWRGGLAYAICLATFAYAGWPMIEPWKERCVRATPLEIGLCSERLELIETVRRNTNGEARILWEHNAASRSARWDVLLPLLTDRSFIGGLDPTNSIEHAYAGLVDQALSGRPITEWSDADLEDYCRRYNIGWIVCWSPAALARFQAWSGVEPTATLLDQLPGQLYRVKQPPSFVLKGKGRWLGADRQRITVADVVPDEDGIVVLSLHYQAGLQASPSRVQVEREPDPYDPIPFIRLRVPGPVARVTLTWQGR
jgi:hypothetical protein